MAAQPQHATPSVGGVTAIAIAKPRLLLFRSATSGKSRRVEGYLAQVLQRNQNHDTFDVMHIDLEARPDLAARFRATKAPTILVIANKRVEGRLEQPRNCLEIRRFLQPWLRS